MAALASYFARQGQMIYVYQGQELQETGSSYLGMHQYFSSGGMLYMACWSVLQKTIMKLVWQLVRILLHVLILPKLNITMSCICEQLPKASVQEECVRHQSSVWMLVATLFADIPVPPGALLDGEPPDASVLWESRLPAQAQHLCFCIVASTPA